MAVGGFVVGLAVVGASLLMGEAEGVFGVEAGEAAPEPPAGALEVFGALAFENTGEEFQVAGPSET